MKTTPTGFKWLETLDGSSTLFSEQFQEACHSTTGAKEETLLHYVRGCKVSEKLATGDPLTLLEVGFGLGVGFLTTWETFKQYQSPWHYISLELDENLLHWFKAEYKEDPFLKGLTWKQMGELKYLEAADGKNKLTILLGNARQTLPLYISQSSIKWSAIYQDAFSPKKNPILWTREWFDFLRNHSDPQVILSTYSASSSIRKSMLESGWRLHAGEKFGPKRTSTRATLIGESDPDILLHLSRSPITALTDESVTRGSL